MTAEVVDTVEAVKAKGVGAATDHVVHALALVAEGEGAGANHVAHPLALMAGRA